jgi:hypothetical protein
MTDPLHGGVPVPRWWVFTFGSDHRLAIAPEPGSSSSYHAEGVSLAPFYIRVQAPTETDARDAFTTLFGPHTWASVRPDDRATRAMIRRRGLVEIAHGGLG